MQGPEVELGVEGTVNWSAGRPLCLNAETRGHVTGWG